MSYKFRRNIDIGSLDAESDKFLLTAFVEKDDLDILKDTSDPKCIILGRTGVGKSALIRYLENTEENIVRIEPESISLRHLSNSDIISYFQKLEVKLDLFYKVLWKHIFIVELIKLCFHNNTSISKNFLEWLREKFPDKKRKQAIDYLEKWEDKFWEHTEYRVKELETSLETRFKEALGGSLSFPDITNLSASTEEEKKEAQKIKYEIINKAQRVINESQVEHIQSILEMLKSGDFTKSQKRFFIIIDDLDKEWVANAIVYDLIKSLIETLKELSDIPGVKIIIAVRTNILKKIFKYNVNRGFQREKFQNLFIEIEWSKKELTELINNRLVQLMKGLYTNASPSINDILPPNHKKHGNAFEYMLERTFMRPRDLIDFFNKCIKNADDKAKFSWEIIRIAEDEYSNERLRALNDEWLENYGNIQVLFKFLRGQNPQFTKKEIEGKAGDYFLEMITNESYKELADALHYYFTAYGENFVVSPILNCILILLYEIGLLGIKIAPDKKLEFIYNSYTAYDESDLTDNTKFVVHPMFRKALRNSQEE